MVVGDDVRPVTRGPAGRGQVVGDELLLPADEQQPGEPAHGQERVPPDHRPAAQEADDPRAGQAVRTAAGWPPSPR